MTVLAHWPAATVAGARRLGVDLLDLVFPPVCAACARPSPCGVVCRLCWTRIPGLPAPWCERCGHPLRNGPCAVCPTLPAFVRSVRSACWVPDPVASAIVAALKYDGWTAVAEPMAERIARLSWPPDVVAERSVIVPVPLSSTRTRERGYNQAALLARGLASRWRLPVVSDLVVRTRATPSQTRLTPSQRSVNVHGAFDVPARGRERLDGAHVVVVDDVLTTGATLHAVAGALFDAGARIISYATFGRARTAAD